MAIIEPHEYKGEAIEMTLTGKELSEKKEILHRSSWRKFWELLSVRYINGRPVFRFRK